MNLHRTDLAEQGYLPHFGPAELDSTCPACGSRGRHAGRRQQLDIYSCSECELVWEVLDATGPACARCGCATRVEPGRGPHFAAARCPSCRHHQWLKTPAKSG